jgi:predicted nucleic acid-binding Zn ribbon protein
MLEQERKKEKKEIRIAFYTILILIPIAIFCNGLLFENGRSATRTQS